MSVLDRAAPAIFANLRLSLLLEMRERMRERGKRARTWKCENSYLGVLNNLCKLMRINGFLIFSLLTLE